MEHEYQALAARIEAFELDEPGVVDTFSRRLARENGWSASHTRRVVSEYKRFLTLAVTAPHVVSPSEDVDQAWHLHVLHAARYRRFCADVLGRSLDHGPSDGGSTDHARFVSAYERTLASYEQRFGAPPPRDIWPDAERRFGADLAVRRVNVAEHWVVRKPALWLWWSEPRSATSTRALLAMGAFAVLAGGCGASLSDRASGPSYLGGFSLLWLMTAGAAYLLKKASLRSTSSTPPPLEPYAIAQLAGGPVMATDSAVTSLIARGCVELEDGTLVAKRAAPEGAPAFERQVYEEIASTGRLELGALRRQAPMLSQELADRLLQDGLVADVNSKLPLLLALVAPLAGTLRIFDRLGSDKPISWLVILTILSVGLAVRMFRPRRERTSLGDRALADARTAHEPLQNREAAPALAESGTLPAMFALFGTAAIVGLPAWTTLLDRRTASYTASGCGGAYSSDGGGGCGGDGGGCGGDGGGCGGCGGGGD